MNLIHTHKHTLPSTTAFDLAPCCVVVCEKQVTVIHTIQVVSVLARQDVDMLIWGVAMSVSGECPKALVHVELVVLTLKTLMIGKT